MTKSNVRWNPRKSKRSLEQNRGPFAASIGPRRTSRPASNIRSFGSIPQ
jgi:hypothetical protein